jgi:hypothetical protein
MLSAALRVGDRTPFQRIESVMVLSLHTERAAVTIFYPRSRDTPRPALPMDIP